MEDLKKYSIVYTSNFLNHYQLAIGKELNKVFKSYTFVAWDKLPSERSKLGFYDLNDNEFVVKAYKDKELARKTIMDADIVLGGYYLYENHIRERLKAGKPVIYSSERLFKTTNIIGTILRYIKYWTKYHSLYKDVNLLCVSAYAASDYNQIFGLFENRTYKWGYFSEVKKYNDIEKLVNNKKKNSIIWTGRLIKWKHPDDAIEVARRLNENGYDFNMNIIGLGPMKKKLESMINEHRLNDKVHMLGSMSPDDVRRYMEESEIYLFTSDRGEGWGVVLNEAMNSGCATVASYSAGSTPYLVKDGVNGLVYRNEDVNELFEKTKYLLDEKNIQHTMSIEAYNTMVRDWSPEVAARRLYTFVDEIIKGNKQPDLYDSNVLSKAEKL